MKKHVVILTFLCLASYFTQGQISSIDLQLNTVPNNDPYAEAGPGGFPLPLHVVSIRAEINDTSTTRTVSKLHVKLGSSSGAGDLKIKVFDLMHPEVSEDGSGMAMNGNSAQLMLGTFEHAGTYYVEVKGEWSDGSFGEVFEDSGP